MQMVCGYFQVVGRDSEFTWAFHDGWKGAVFETLAPDQFRMLAQLHRHEPPDQHARWLTVSADGPWLSRIASVHALQSGFDPGIPVVELVAEPMPAVAGALHLPRLVTARSLETDPPVTREIRYHLVAAGALSDPVVAAMGQPDRAVYVYANGPSAIVVGDAPAAPERKQGPPK